MSDKPKTLLDAHLQAHKADPHAAERAAIQFVANDIVTENAKLRQDLAEALALLRKHEFAARDDMEDNYCPECETYPFTGAPKPHTEGCKLAALLARCPGA